MNSSAESQQLRNWEKEIARREERLLRIELARRELLTYVEFTKKDYKANWHHRLLCDYLQAFINGEIQKLMVWMPPQYGKSELTSRRLPSFKLGIHPTSKIAICSYSADLAYSFNRDVKRIIQSEDYQLIFPDTKINEKNVKNSAKGSFLNNANLFEIIDKGGALKATGVGGPLSGYAVDMLLIDDPVKDAVEGDSITDQDKKWDWYMKVARTRLHKDSQQLITMTRWNKNDLSGKILANFPTEWEVLKLEAIKKTHCFINPKYTKIVDPREFGEALWPERHSKSDVLATAKADPSTFDALYQQDPRPSKNRLYATGFDYERIVRKISYKKSLPLHYTVDFNSSPYMSGLVAQLEYIEDGFWMGHENYYELRVIDKFALASPLNDAQSLGREFENKYQDIRINGYFQYGDASGNNNTGLSSSSDNIKTKTLFSDLLSGLSDKAGAMVEKRIPKSNPRYRSIGKGMMGRRVFLNKMLLGIEIPVRVLIDPKCNELIDDLENCTQDANGKLAKPKNKQGIEERGHMIQAFEYLICYPDALGYLAEIS